MRSMCRSLIFEGLKTCRSRRRLQHGTQSEAATGCLRFFPLVSREAFEHDVDDLPLVVDFEELEVVEPDSAGHFGDGHVASDFVDIDIASGGFGVEAEGFVEGFAEDFDFFESDLPEVVEIGFVIVFDNAFGEDGVAGVLDLLAIDFVEPDAVVGEELGDCFCMS